MKIKIFVFEIPKVKVH